MATIRRYPFFKQARVEASQFLAVYRNGRPITSGRGLAVWFSPHGSTSLVEIPADERDHELQISATTRDFQTISVLGTATWRAAEPMTLADRIDFSIDLVSGVYRADPISQVEGLIDGLVTIAVERYVSARPVSEVLHAGVAALLASIEAEIAATPRLAAIGVELSGVRLSALSPSPDLVRALRQPTVERLQQAADEATFARRAAAVEKEAAIAENETKAKIKLEEERAQLIARERDNEVARAEAQRETTRVAAEGSAETRRIASQAEAKAIVELDEAKLRGERERAEIARTLPQMVVLADAMKEGLGNSHIGTLNLGPDVMSLITQALTGAAGGKAA